MGLAGQQVLRKMAAPQSGDEIQQPGQHHKPGGLKMESAAPAVLVGQDEAVAGGDNSAGSGDRNLEQGRRQDIAGFTPIEARVRNQNFDASDQQGQETERGNPVSDPNQRGM